MNERNSARRTKAVEAQAVLDLPGMAPDRVLHARSKPSRRSREPVQSVPVRASKPEKAPASQATIGLLRRGWQHSSQSSRKGIHLIRHMLPHWSDGAGDLEELIAVWIACGTFPARHPETDE
jgi:hypothetical protein